MGSNSLNIMHISESSLLSPIKSSDVPPWLIKKVGHLPQKVLSDIDAVRDDLPPKRNPSVLSQHRKHRFQLAMQDKFFTAYMKSSNHITWFHL